MVEETETVEGQDVVAIIVEEIVEGKAVDQVDLVATTKAADQEVKVGSLIVDLKKIRSLYSNIIISKLYNLASKYYYYIKS